MSVINNILSDVFRNTCSIDGCKKPKDRQGLCQMHNWRLKHYGNVNYKTKKKTCLVDNCDRKHKGYGLCSLHYLRKKKGLPLDYTPPVLETKRYKSLSKPHHPLATKRGAVYEHRMVLFDSIGYNQVPCFWCGKGLVFSENLFVDHLNHDRHDNTEQNLVPSCNSCNAGRTRRNPTVRKSIYLNLPVSEFTWSIDGEVVGS